MRAIMTMIGLVLAATAALPARAQDKPIYQLRVYELNEASKPVFHARFRDHAMRIMKRHGFDIVRGPDEAALKAAWTAFRADEEWIRVKAATVSPDAPIMGGIEDRTMALTDYSPAFR